MDEYLSAGRQEGEVELNESKECKIPLQFFITRCRLLTSGHLTFYLALLPEFNAAAMSQLEAMGFPLIRCQKALLATGNSDPEAAMNWLFEHMEDSGMLPFHFSACYP
jgi:hypothetical protein